MLHCALLLTCNEINIKMQASERERGAGEKGKGTRWRDFKVENQKLGKKEYKMSKQVTLKESEGEWH